MKRIIVILVFVFALTQFAFGQTPTPTPTPSPQRPVSKEPVQQREALPFQLADYGVSFQADTRLIIVMAALEMAGFDAQPGTTPSEFRLKIRRDLANLDPDLQGRMKNFYERNRLPAPATPADQAARYVSLALVLSPAPDLTAPERSDDLPAGLLDVLDFAPLLKEFYRRSGIEEHLVTYVRAYQAEGDRLRQPTSEMLRSLLTYLHTRPITTTYERVEVKAPSTSKKKQNRTYSTRQKDRRFLILPDLLAPRGAINFRVIGEDYYAIVPEGTDPVFSELRRAYLQYVIDALVLRFNKEIAARRDDIRKLLDVREKAGSQVSADVFLTVGRSLVAAVDARYDEALRLALLIRSGRARLGAAKDDATRTSIGKDVQAQTASIQDDTIARLADEYEKGAVLTFFFSDQLKGIETAGFDIANFFPDMLASFDPTREAKRPAEYADARQRSVAAREARIAARKAELASASNDSNNPRETALIKELAAIEDTLRTKNYSDAEARLKGMLRDYPGEPRIFFALGQTASLAAMDATDDPIQIERLNRALGQYRLAIQASSPESDKAILSRAHEAMGRINAFLDNKNEALREFDEAIKIGEVRGGAYQQALEGKKRLSQP
jgi:hypothetical protein